VKGLLMINRYILHTAERRKANWIGRLLLRHCLL